MPSEPSNAVNLAPKFDMDESGSLWLAPEAGDRRQVSAKPCFPWSVPGKHISIRNLEGEEILVLETPDSLDNDSRRALESAMAQSGFVLEITTLESVEPEFELRRWKVITKQGPRQFQTRLDDWPRPLPSGGLLVRDVAGDIYVTPPPDTLDPLSRKLLWAFMD